MELVNVELEAIMSPQKISDRFTKQEFVVKYDENPQYPQFIKLELVNKAVGRLDEFKPGDIVDVLFDLKGRKYEKDQETRYYTSLQAWKVSKAYGQQTATATAEAPANPDFDDAPF